MLHCNTKRCEDLAAGPSAPCAPEVTDGVGTLWSHSPTITHARTPGRASARGAGEAARPGRTRAALLGLALGLAALVGVGGRLPAAWAQEELFVTNNSGNSVTVYARTANGDTAPLRTLTGVATGLLTPEGVVLDAVHDELIVASGGNNSIRVFARTAEGNVAPVRTLAGGATGLGNPIGVVVDPIHDELVVPNGFVGGNILVFPRTANGNVAPLRTLTGAAVAPSALFVDLVNDELLVADANNSSIQVFGRTASGSTPPLRTLVGAATGLHTPWGVVVDPVHDELVVANVFANSLTVYPRTANGNVAPLRTLAGADTSISSPRGVVVDSVHDELVVVNSASVAVHGRAATGNVVPLRTIAGGLTGLSSPQYVASTTSPPLLAAVLPGSRSVSVGTAATAFAAIINNAGAGPAAGCAPTPITPVPAAFSFQTTNALNQLTGTPNRAANVPAGATQHFVFSLTPTAPFGPTDVLLGFACQATNRAAEIVGLNSLLLVAAAGAVPDVIALAATSSNNGIVTLASAGAFAVATVNVGASGTITVAADTGGATLPLTLAVCQTDPQTAACLAPPAPSVTTQIDANATPTFSIFANATGPIPFLPGTNRIFVRFTDQGGVIRGATSVAVRTL